MTIEILTAANISPLTQLVTELWEECSYEEEFEHYSRLIGSANEICYLASEQDQYAGFIHLGIRNDYVEGAEELPVAYIEAIYVKPAFRHGGIARGLMSAAETWARQKGFRQIASDTPVKNTTGIDFHKKMGFAEVERVVCFLKEL